MDEAEQGAMPPAFPHTADWVGVVGGLFPFLFTYHEVREVNGVVVSYVDYVAIVGGIVALAAGAMTIPVLRRTPAETRAKRIAATGVLFALAFVQLALRGFGLI